jgi:hypothetical protein
VEAAVALANAEFDVTGTAALGGRDGRFQLGQVIDEDGRRQIGEGGVRVPRGHTEKHGDLGPEPPLPRCIVEVEDGDAAGGLRAAQAFLVCLQPGFQLLEFTVSLRHGRFLLAIAGQD